MKLIQSKVQLVECSGTNCKIQNRIISERILEAGCEIEAAALSRSLIGRQAKVQGRGDGQVLRLNTGDNSSVISR